MARKRAFGLDFQSALDLPEMAASDAGGPADVTIRLTRDPRRRFARSDDPLTGVSRRGDTIALEVEAIRFTLGAGRSIAIDAPGDAGDADIRLWLTGTVMAALLVQRGALVLHANLVRLPGGGAAAFLGPSGAGKSTLAAALETAGLDALGDDLCAVEVGGGAPPRVHEGLARIKLWPGSIERLGLSAPDGGFEPVGRGIDKVHVPSRLRAGTANREPLMLRRLFLLDWRGPAEPALAPVRGAEAVSALIDHTYRWDVGQALVDDPRRQFDQAVELARQVPLTRFARGRDWAGWDRDLALLLAELRAS